MDNITINLAMIKISDKVLELEEHLKYEQELLDELKQLMRDWGNVLPVTDSPDPKTEKFWRDLIHRFDPKVSNDSQ